MQNLSGSAKIAPVKVDGGLRRNFGLHTFGDLDLLNSALDGIEPAFRQQPFWHRAQREGKIMQQIVSELAGLTMVIS